VNRCRSYEHGTDNNRNRSEIDTIPSMTPSDARALIDRYGDTPCLTDRQRQILGLLADGSTIDQVATELGISPGTVKVHLARAKIHARLYDVRRER
jgi:DNA-binding CsgD family transcriptional regulator